ncbi:glycosyltransferase family 2 protein [Paenibacillus herberti]|nr:glycosyltransferase family 2 protein [Paenibacillus herberti]
MSWMRPTSGEPASVLRPGVTFETKCYEQDWQQLLLSDRLRRAIEFHAYPFAERILYINNVERPELVSQHAQKLVDTGVLTSYVVVEEHSEEALRFFGLSREDFQGGYWYSIAELVSIYLCRTEYLLHYAGDCMLENAAKWVEPALERMRLQPSIVCANPVPNGWFEDARREAMLTRGDFHYGYGFSDQCYLIRTMDFRARIYGEKHPASERYPAYGGQLFEKRVDAWMRCSGLLRLTWRHDCYWHRSVRNPVSQDLLKISGLMKGLDVDGSTERLGLKKRLSLAENLGLAERLFSMGNPSLTEGIKETGVSNLEEGVNRMDGPNLVKSLNLAEPALACYQAGVRAMEENDYDTAILWLQLAVSARSREQQAGREPDPGLKWLPQLQLAVCYDRLGKTQKAWLSNEAASVHAPHGQPSIASNRIYLRDRRLSEAAGKGPLYKKAVDGSGAGNSSGSGELLLSVLIPTLPDRSAAMGSMMEELQAQMLGLPVELLVLTDNRKRTTGAKRNSLLKQAQGRFIVFIDDDDRITEDYVHRLLEQIEREPDADCIVFDVMVHSGGKPLRPCKYGTEYQYGMDANFYYRKPNHLMAYRREIAQRHHFADVSFGEDDEWAGRASADVKRQLRIDAVLYHYDWEIRPQSWYGGS